MIHKQALKIASLYWAVWIGISALLTWGGLALVPEYPVATLLPVLVIFPLAMADFYRVAYRKAKRDYAQSQH